MPSALDHASNSSHNELPADLPVWDNLNKQTKNKHCILNVILFLFDLEESSYGSRQPVYNEIYKSADFNGGSQNLSNNGGYLAPRRHGKLE